MRPQLLLIATALWMGIVKLAAQAPADDPNLINITTLEQLDAIRYDLNGNGRADNTAGATAYSTAFGTPSCAGNCQGYELRNDLDFNDTDAVMPGNQLSIWAENAVSTSVTNAVTGGWVPIGYNYNNSFLATFDGNGQKISNLYINTSTLSDVGLFGTVGRVGSDGEIRNLGLEGGSVTSTSSNASVGGLVGTNRNQISNCYATGGVTGGDNSRVGGLVGSGFAKACYATGGVTGGDRANVGGLMGAGSAKACYATGSVEGGDNARVGGLAGSSSANACYATGDVTGGNNARVGGLVGLGSPKACYATGNVEGGDNARVGGLVGSGSATTCYFDKSVAILTKNMVVQDGSAGKEKLGVGNDNSSRLLGKSKTDLQSLVAYDAVIASDASDQGALYRNWYEFGENGKAYWSLCGSDQYPKLRVDFDLNGTPSVAEFGTQDDCSASNTPLPTGVRPPVAPKADSELVKEATKNIDALETSQGTQDAEITSLKTSQGTQDTEIAALKARLQALESASTSNAREREMTFNVPQKAGDRAGAYPNPAAEVIRFRGLSAGSSYNYALYSLGGSKVLAGSLDRETIDIGALSAGQYILVLQDDYLAEVLREAILIE